MSDQIRVNGSTASWGHIVLKCGNERYYGFDSISFADKRERTKGYGTGKHHAPNARSHGKYSTDPVKLRGPVRTIEALRQQLAALSSDGTSYGNAEFQITVQFATNNEPPILVEIERCVYVGTSASHEEGPDILKEEIEVDCMLIRRNGLTLFDASGPNSP